MRIALAAGLAAFMPVLAYAATQTVTERASYSLGDNDTRAQAREICLGKVERKALEASGSLVESEMDVNSNEGGGAVNDSAQAHVRSYVGAVVSATGVKDSFHLDGERLVVDCEATVTFDPDDVRAHMQSAQVDKTTQSAVNMQWTRLAQLEAQVTDLKLKLAQQAQAQQMQAQAQALAQAQQAQAQRIQAQMQAQAQAQAIAQGQMVQAQHPPAPPIPQVQQQAAAQPLADGQPPLPQAQPRPSVQEAPLPPGPPPRFQVEAGPPPAPPPGMRPPPPGMQPPPPPAQAQMQPLAQPPSDHAVWNNPQPQTASAESNQAARERARYVRVGMRTPDLIKIMGAPISATHEYFRIYSLNYGSVWVTLNGGMVQCISTHQNPGCRWLSAQR